MVKLILLLSILIGCTHQLVHEQRLDTHTVSDQSRKTNTHRGPGKCTAPYTDKQGNPHPATTEWGPVDTTAIYTGHFVADTHWYDFLKSKWKFGLPWWIWIVGSFTAVLIVIFIFHHFTVIGRISALWKKVSGP